jgi:hypothetical protein
VSFASLRQYGCPNPKHLYLGTQAENMADMIAKGRNPFGDRHWTRCGARSHKERKAVQTLEERFWAKVYKTHGCWFWIGSTNQCGYGLFGIGGSGHTMVAHKVHWIIIAKRKLAAGMKLLHKCDTPGCVRLGHLFVGTPLDNMQDMLKKGVANWNGPTRLL